MFDSVKIVNECKKILKKHGIPYCEDYMVFKEHGLIHCQLNDWRGTIEVDGFPVLTTKDAVGLLIECCASTHYCYVEADNRERLVKEYQAEYGEYEPRKFVFESILNVLKDYDQKTYQKSIQKYTMHINTNRKPKNEWSFNTETKKFETDLSPESFAVVIYKSAKYVQIYQQDPCGGRPYDNIYQLLTSEKSDSILSFTFTNSGDERFCLDVYDPNLCDESEKYILIGKADKVVWTYYYDVGDQEKKRTRTFLFDCGKVHISEETTDRSI